MVELWEQILTSWYIDDIQLILLPSQTMLGLFYVLYLCMAYKRRMEGKITICWDGQRKIDLPVPPTD